MAHDKDGAGCAEALSTGAGQTAWARGGGGLLGTLAQPAMPRMRPAKIAGPARRSDDLIDARVGLTVTWLAFEIILGLAAFAFIVWWTLPRGKREDKANLSPRRHEDTKEHEAQAPSPLAGEGRGEGAEKN